MRRTAAAGLAALMLAGTAVAVAAPPAPPLAADAIDPALVLPPPPAETGPVAAEELAGLRAIAARRSAAELAVAEADDRVKDVSIFDRAVGPGVALLAMPQTARLFALVRAEEKRDADRAKALFARKRPWIVDPAIGSCSTDDAALSSYPSGHTTMGYAMAAVLARLIPARAPAIMARAADYGRSRLVCAMHFASDVAAGQALGMVIAERLMADRAFRAQFDAARAEFGAAGASAGGGDARH